MKRSFLLRNLALCFAVIAMLGGLSACTVTTTGSQTDAITRSGGWVFDSFATGTTSTPSANQTIVYTGMTAVFTASGSVTFTTTAAAQMAGAPATYAGTWSLSGLTTLTLTVPNLYTGTFSIDELTATALQYSGAGLTWKWKAK